MRRQQLSDEVASYLRQAIMAGELAPGESVRAEALGDQLDVSATPVREALHALRVEGFLDLVPRKGFAVAPLTADDIRDIYEAHALIAGELAARAATRADDAQLAALRKVHESFIEAARSGATERLERFTHEFHRSLYVIAGSERLRWALSSFVKYVPSAFHSQIDGWGPKTTETDHGEIFEALQNRDSEKARSLMAQHIRKSGDKLAEHFAGRQRAQA